MGGVNVDSVIHVSATTHGLQPVFLPGPLPCKKQPFLNRYFDEVYETTFHKGK